MQPIPSVSEADLKRILKRDFSSTEEKARQLLFQMPLQGGTRVRLAVLKLANRDLDSLKSYVRMAAEDYRDVLAYAEYPLYSKKVFGIDNLPEESRNQIIEEDWKQYQTWLNAE